MNSLVLSLSDNKNAKGLGVVAFFVILLSILLIFLTNYNGVSIPEIVMVAIFAFVFCIVPKRFIVPIVGFVFMLDIWLPFSLIVLVATIVKLIKTKFSLKFEKDSAFLLLFLVLRIVPVVTENLDIVIYFKGFISVILEVYLYKSIESREEGKNLGLMMILGYFVLAGMTLFIALNRFDIVSIVTKFRLGSGTMTYWLPQYSILPNENNLARYSVLCIAVCLVLKAKKDASTPFCIITCAFSVFILLMTQSRSGLLLLAALFVLFVIFYNPGSITKKMKFVTIFVGLAGLLLIVLIIVFPTVLEKVLYRFSENDDLSNGRLEIVNFYHNAWINGKTSWLLFGFGDQNVANRFGINDNVHSALQAYFVQYGILGAFSFFAFLFLYAKSFSKKMDGGKNTIVWIPFLVIAIGKLFGAMNNTELFISMALASIAFSDAQCYATNNYLTNMTTYDKGVIEYGKNIRTI